MNAGSRAWGETRSEDRSAVPSAPVNLLLVDDDNGDVKAVTRAFRQSRIANPITRAVDGVEALRILQGADGAEPLARPYVLLADLNMPRMNGIDLLKAMRSDAALRDTVVFMLTTSRREEDKIAAYGLNVAGYIVKETAGADFANLVHLMETYWRIVELPH